MKQTANPKLCLRRVATTRPDQWLYLLADKGVLYSETQKRFVGLNAAGVSAFQAFDAGASADDLRAGRGALPRSSVTADDIEAIFALSLGVFPAEDSRVEWPALREPCTANIEIHDVPVLVEFPEGSLEELCRDYFRKCPPSAKPARCHVYAQHTEAGWTIYVNGCGILLSLADEQLGLGFLHAARSLLYAESNYDVAFHAAMVANERCGVLLSGARETGKSTLAAHLVFDGFELLSDEPVLLHLDTVSETGSVPPLCLPISLKEGSWAILEHEWEHGWPELAGAPLHVRSDGTRIRLLHPTSARYPMGSRRPTLIIFPQYRSSFATCAERLSPFETLNLLSEAGMILSKDLSRDKFEAFLTMLCSTPAYTLSYSSLQEAAMIMRRLSERIVD